MEKVRVIQGLRQMADHGVFCDPLLAHHVLASTSVQEVCLLARQLTDTLVRRFVRFEYLSDALGNIPFSAQLMSYCLLETLISTAIDIAHAEDGYLYPTETTLYEAEARLHKFLLHHGMAGLYVLYLVIAGHDLLQPFYSHKEVSEPDFLQGIRHHPYPREHLELMLILAAAMGALRVQPGPGGVRTVQLTKKGVQWYRWSREVLLEAGYLAKRGAFSYVYQFDTVADWDEMCKVVWPDTVELRRRYLEWVDIPGGAHVLEVACGTGTLTFDAGLYQAVSPGGRLVCVDHAAGMIKQAQRKHTRYEGAQHVTFLQASCEQLPFVDAVFDVVLGCAFLNQVDGRKALQEMTRTVVPGGIVSVFQALQTHLLRPFFREWFEPLFDLAGGRSPHRFEQQVPTESEIVSWFHDAGLRNVQAEKVHGTWVFHRPEVVVQHIIRAFSFFETELLSLPWDDQRTIINELIDRGMDVCRKYPLADRTIRVPILMVKAIRPYV